MTDMIEKVACAFATYTLAKHYIDGELAGFQIYEGGLSAGKKVAFYEDKYVAEDECKLLNARAAIEALRELDWDTKVTASKIFLKLDPPDHQYYLAYQCFIDAALGEQEKGK